jgi:hypothetical protein
MHDTVQLTAFRVEQAGGRVAHAQGLHGGRGVQIAGAGTLRPAVLVAWLQRRHLGCRGLQSSPACAGLQLATPQAAALLAHASPCMVMSVPSEKGCQSVAQCRCWCCWQRLQRM